MSKTRTIDIPEYIKHGLASIKAQFEKPGDSDLVSVLARLVAKGKPVSTEELAEATGWNLEQTRDVLSRYPIDRDESGLILGFVLTLKPTPHKFTFDDISIFGWCAADVLFAPVVLGKPGVAESKCPVTKHAIRVEVSPQGVLSVDPPDAVVSAFRPTEKVQNIRTDLCDLGHFYSSREAAAEWLKVNPEGQLNSVPDDFEIQRRISEEIGWTAKEQKSQAGA